MSQQAMASLRRSVDEARQVVESLSPDEWSAPSACSGWSVKDLVAHMSSNFKETVEPSPPPPQPIEIRAEEAMEALVAPRKSWTDEQVRDEFLTYAEPALAGLEALQAEPLASTPLALADLGTYPMNQLADAYAFDVLCHVRFDLLAPYGPVERTLAPADDALVAPAVGWMLAGLPQMQPGLVGALTGRLRLELTGAGGSTHDLVALDGEILVVEPSGDADAVVTSDAQDFVRWGTARQPWRDHCVVEGSASVAETFLDALNII